MGSDDTQYMSPVGVSTEEPEPQDLSWRPDMELIFRERDTTFYLVSGVDDGQPYRYMSRKQRALLRTFLNLALEELSDVEGGNGN